MLKLLPSSSSNIVVVSGSGEITAADYETVLIPAVASAHREHARLRMLYELASDVTGFSMGAMWDDMKLGVGHWQAWEKIAVVTDVGWVAGAIGMFRFAMPCPVRAFTLKDRASAETWIAA